MWKVAGQWRRRAPALGVVCLLGVAPAALAGEPCTKTFVPGGAIGNITWHDDANWTPFGVPSPVDVACIVADGMYQVVVTEPVAIAGLQLDVVEGATQLKILDPSFTLSGFGYVAGDTKLKVNTGGVIDGGGVLEIRSKLVIEGGTVAVDVELYGHLNWTSSGSVTGTLVTYPGSKIEVENPIDNAHLTVAHGFELHGELVFNDAIRQSMTVLSGSLVNAADGSIRTRTGVGSATVVPELRAELVNEGTVNVTGLDLRIARGGSQHENLEGGTVVVAAAELEIDLGDLGEVPSNFTNYGTTTVAGGGTIRIAGRAGVREVPSNFTNYGTTTVASGGGITVVGRPGGDAPTTLVNHGFVDLETGAILKLVDAYLDNLPSGVVGGTGVLDVSAALGVSFGGTFDPGWSPGVLTVIGSVGLAPSAAVAIEVGGELPGVNLDQLEVTGILTAGGALNVSLLPPYHPSGGERFEVLTYDHISGWFNKVELPPLMNLLAWNVVVDEHATALEVSCQGTQLGVEVVADRDPVSTGHELVYQATVVNHSSVAASEVVVSDQLPSSLAFRPDLSSPQCQPVGSAVECAVGNLAPLASATVAIAADAVVAGTIDNTVTVRSWECDTDVADNQATVIVEAVAAEPCDANYDLAIDGDDLAPAARHIFGPRAVGNPDCRLGDGVTADDLAAIIEASQ